MVSDKDLQTISTLGEKIQKLRKIASKYRGYDWRIAQLNKLVKMFEENEKEFADALFNDLHRDLLLKTMEPKFCINEAKDAIAHLKEWMQPEFVSNRTIANMPGTAYIVKDAFGVVLVIAPWNYPVQLVVKPLVGALAAGNVAVVKPSEVSEHCSALFAKLIPKYFSDEEVVCVEGGVEVTTELLKHKFDYILYTGNTAVGKIVMRAASEHLTPVTLELGGKSPVIVDKGIPVETSVRRILWGKFLNAGQTCIAPDYTFVHKDIIAEFKTACKKIIKEFYGEDAQKSSDFGRIVNERHVGRLQKLLAGNENKILCGGKVDIKDKFIAPTLVENPDLSASIMNDEIFGPLFPILEMESVSKACEYINSKPKPLALYLFSNDQATIDFVTTNTSSGGVCINDVISHTGLKTMGFGGVGDSGMGAVNSKYTFDTFSHKKSVLKKPFWFELKQKYPPYTSSSVKGLDFAFIDLPSLNTVLMYGFALVSLVLAILYARKK